MGILKRLVFPPICVGCGEKFNIFSKDFTADSVFCQKCRAEWEIAKITRCGKCGCVNIDCLCAPYLLKGINVVSLVKFGDKYAADSLIYCLKKHNIKRVFDFAADEMSRHFITYVRERSIDLSNSVITNVPRKRSSVTNYGFDHARRLAELISQNLGIEYCESLVRRRGGRDQKKLDAVKRLENAKGKFELCSESQDKIGGRLIILVDDVVTSGATAAACIETLKEAEPMGVIILSIAKNDYSAKTVKRTKNKKLELQEKGGSDGVV